MELRDRPPRFDDGGTKFDEPSDVGIDRPSVIRSRCSLFFTTFGSVTFMK